MINRRQALGLIAAIGFVPSRGRANVAPQRSEIRESLAKHFTDAGTAGTFVGYKVDEYLVIASDSVRSGAAKLPASTFKIPNSIIALETGVVGDPDTDVFKWDGIKRPIEAWNRDHTMRTAIAASAVPVYQEIARRIGPQSRLARYGRRRALLQAEGFDPVGVHRLVERVDAEGQCLDQMDSQVSRFRIGVEEYPRWREQQWIKVTAQRFWK